MTSKERFLTAMTNNIPDRVPCSPDISNYIPCRKTGLPYWDIYFKHEIPLWEAYCHAAAYYQIDMWLASCTSIPFLFEDRDVEMVKNHIYNAEKDAMIEKISYKTPDGVIEEEQLCYRNDPPTHLTRIMKDLGKDWKSFRWLLKPPTAIDSTEFNKIKKACVSSNQAFGCALGYPGFHSWEGLIEGSITPLTYTYYDNPNLLQEWFETDMEYGTKAMELYLAQKPDYILFGGSGTLTLSSPEIVKKYTLPALTLWSSMAKDAGVATMLHSCGKSRQLVDMLVDHTDIQCINPLEVPPMGDADLAEVKKSQGKNIALMGNLHTTNLMLYGSAEDVYKSSCEAIDMAGDQGGFILSTGDQCPRDTPDENIMAMVQAAKDFGRYW